MIVRGLYWLIFIVLAGQLFSFVDAYAVDLFFNDQWSYLTTSLYPNDVLSGFLTPLGPHRIGLGYPFFKTALEWSDFNNRSIAFMVAGFTVINALIFTRLKTLYVGPLQLTDIYIPLVFFNLSQYATYLSNPNITIHQLTFFFLLVLLWLFSGRLSGIKWGLVMLLTPLICFTGNGFFVTAALLGFSLLMLLKDKASRGRWLALAVVTSVSLATYLFTANYKALDCAGMPPETPLYYLQFFKGLMLNGLVISYQDSWFSWVLFLALLAGALYFVMKLLLPPPRNNRLSAVGTLAPAGLCPVVFCRYYHRPLVLRVGDHGVLALHPPCRNGFFGLWPHPNQ